MKVLKANKKYHMRVADESTQQTFPSFDLGPGKLEFEKWTICPGFCNCAKSRTNGRFVKRGLVMEN